MDRFVTKYQQVVHEYNSDQDEVQKSLIDAFYTEEEKLKGVRTLSKFNEVKGLFKDFVETLLYLGFYWCLDLEKGMCPLYRGNADI